MDTTAPAYEIGDGWKIVQVNEAFCREFKCSESGLIGRDIRDLMRADWRLDFRSYVSRALVGVGDVAIALPMVAPCGDEGWYTHQIEAIMRGAVVSGYRATITPREIDAGAAPHRWFAWRAAEPRPVWNFEADHVEPAT